MNNLSLLWLRLFTRHITAKVHILEFPFRE